MSLRTRLAVLACSVAACTLVLPACSQHNTTAANSSAATRALADLPQPVITNAKDYIAKLERFNAQLDDINSSNAALKALPSIAESVQPINKLTAQLSALSPDVKSKLGVAFGDQFASLNSDYAAHADRLLGSSETASLFKSTFNNVRLLGQTTGGRWNSTTTAGIDAEYGN